MGGIFIPDARGGLVWLHGTNAAGDPVKLGVVHGYDAQYAEWGSDLNGVAGTNVKNLAVVPAGEVWHILNVDMRDQNSVCERQVRALIGGNYYFLGQELGVGAGRVTIWRGDIILAAGNRLVCVWVGVTLNDDLYWNALGYKMKVV